MEHCKFGEAPAGAAIVNERALRTLSSEEINDVSGGFVCGGFCLAGAAFGAGALFGSGFAIGYYNAQ